MLRLRTFGTPRVEGAGGPLGGAAAQRKPLALLALLAAAGGRGMSRDKLVAYLWPESPADRSTHRLSQMLYALRRDLDAEAFILGAGDLRLDPACITSDLGEFVLALREGRLEEAVGVHAGAFLDGFHLSDAEEFEQWADEERSRHAEEFRNALEALASAAGRRGDREAAVGWWRRLTAADRLNTRAVLGLVNELCAGGDRAGALQAAMAHEALLRKELGVAADPALTALVTDLRGGTALPASGSGSAAPRAARGQGRARVLDLFQRRLGSRYAVRDEIGRGSAATVYRAEDLKHRRIVAVKLLRPEIALSLSAQRFLREIRLLGGLRHPHILPLYDSGEVDEVPYYVMPYVAGGCLRARLDREGQLPMDDALRIAREVAEALDYAHRQGVLHRDIRPGNILLDEGHAVVADFGLARVLSAAGEPGLTAPGEPVGAPVYVSPEQAAGEREIDGRSDLYSLGRVLYEMLAGAPPHDDPAPRLHRLRRVPAALDEVVDRAMARIPADRYATAGQFAAALAPSPPLGWSSSG